MLSALVHIAVVGIYTLITFLIVVFLLKDKRSKNYILVDLTFTYTFLHLARCYDDLLNWHGDFFFFAFLGLLVVMIIFNKASWGNK